MHGISQRALAAWAGTARLPLLAQAGEQLARLPVVAASARLALFVAGARVPATLVGEVPEELVARDGGELRARVAIVPTARGVIVCDRLDADPRDGDRVCWPDDSSYHLARAIPPGRRASWLDLGCGSALAAIERPELADRVRATDLNARAVRYAALGARLSGIAIDARVADLGAGGDGGDRYELVTCNAPIPNGDGPRWRATDGAFVDRLFARTAALVAPAGLAVVHAALDALLAATSALPGDVRVVAYTPEDAPRGFGVAWWAPDAPSHRTFARRELTHDRPHIDWRDRDDAHAL